MTNHWIDYQHSDVFMAIGGNTAENHPISMKWIEKAREEKGAKLITVDPRFNRTAAVSDLYVPLRPGTNTAYLGGLAHYILENNLYHREYVEHYTNATYLIEEGFEFDDVAGVFSGIEDDPARNAKKYDRTTWQYQRDEDGNVKKDPFMQDPNCVMNLMREHFRNYSIENVSQITGCPVDTLEESYRMFSTTGKPERAGNILYAMGITQFTHGAQNVRAIGLVQLLLGNMGRAGGGVNAQRGQSNVQGATDMAILYHIIPGYMGTPQQAAHPTLGDYIEKETPETGWWSNKPRYLISLLKAFYGENATADNQFAYQWLPKLDGKDASHIAMYKNMSKGEVEGMICWADNPAVSGPTAGAKREYSAKMKWLVSVDLFENETASFWKREAGANPEEIDTEVFILPAAASYEREGNKANSGRWIQWQWKAQEPPGNCKSDLWIVNELFKKLQKIYEEEGGAVPEQITKMAWDYDGNDGQVDIVKVCKDINGYNVNNGSLVNNFLDLQLDGSTACGNWLYSGYYNDLDNPPTKRRTPEKEGIGSHLDWSFAWPLNRRIVYNRASADPSGKPWNPDVPQVWWDEDEGKWKTNDVPDFNVNIPPQQSAEIPFIMLPEGQGRLFSAFVNDGPFPAHYEPADSPVPNLLYPEATYNPISQRFYEDHVVETEEEKERYPYVLTTYRVVEHYQSGIMTRNMPWLIEMMPEFFVEIDEELADKLGIANGDRVAIESKRLYNNGEQDSIEAKACVTKRLQPLMINGQKKHIVGLPFHWGYMGKSTGAVANDLTPSVGDPNTTIPEFKASLCNIRRVG